MKFKVTKPTQKPKRRLVSYRLPVDLLEALQRVADTEEIPTTRLVEQMLQTCLDAYEPTKRVDRKRKLTSN